MLERIRPLAYRLELPPSLEGVHDVFHVSMLHENVTELYHTLHHPKVEYTTAVREEMRLEKIMNTRDMQPIHEMAREGPIAGTIHKGGDVGT